MLAFWPQNRAFAWDRLILQDAEALTRLSAGTPEDGKISAQG
jgi:hypothetical protein